MSDHLIPVHIVAGPLGVGKTTAILHYVEHHAETENVAILVNDFGPVGMDGAIMAGALADEQPQVITIPGGCLCCASADAFAKSIPKLAGLPGITRIIIEPSGLAMPAQVVDLLRSLADEHHLELRPTVVMLDAAEFRAEIAEHMPYYRRLVEAGDILVANRCDKATEGAIANFRGWAERLDPPKFRVLTTTQGELPDEIFAVSLTESMAKTPTAHHEHDHHHHPQRADGATWSPEHVFDLNRLRTVIHNTTLKRFKGIFHTDTGWKLLQVARGELTEQFTDHRRDSRADWISEDHVASDLMGRLEGCQLKEAQ